ncbi:hypothetical protein [Pseudorhodobacter sp.]|uniref:hypothetical protein n=1 Tax=Pseudorhodobacter sp. TaxID=1934400 RepID=UPI002649B957|nr:hypothetical protein [Pseudorhodobacter sp.]MDN5786416.1 hypothetical protein [Pseudorhodobacter sp.]
MADGNLVLAVTLALSLSAPLWAQTAQPDAAEAAIFQTAQQSGIAADYRAYLSQYPNGVFAEIARFELEWATQAGTAKTTEEPTAALPETTVASPEPGTTASQTGIGFETQLHSPGTPVDGKTIAELIKGSPLFPPIEGIPENMWKNQTCSNCHQWTKEALCTQGATYTGPNGPHSLAKLHPYGGAFKAALLTFALEGCQ